MRSTRPVRIHVTGHRLTRAETLRMDNDGSVYIQLIPRSRHPNPFFGELAPGSTARRVDRSTFDPVPAPEP
jgi:hypothetical protein